jgi:TIR domain
MTRMRRIIKSLRQLQWALAVVAVTGSLIALQTFTDAKLHSVVLGVLGSLFGVLLSLSLGWAATRRSKHPRVFISYSKADADFATKLASALAGLGVKPILDREVLLVGDRVEATVRELIDQSDYVIFVASNASRESNWARTELQEAFRRRKPVLPVVLQRDAIPEELRNVYYADFTGDPHRGFMDLARVLTPGKAESPMKAAATSAVGRG